MSRLRKAIGFGLAGSAFYVAQDAINDALIYVKALHLSQKYSHDHAPFLSALGASSSSDVTYGPWYNSSVTMTHSGLATTVVIPCRGPEPSGRASDITIRMIRKQGLRWPLLYNIVDGQWDIMILDARIGVMDSISLLEKSSAPLR